MTWAVRIRAGGRLGTGAVISRTLVLTCEHVVRGAETVTVVTESGASEYRVVTSDASLDVALLEPRDADERLPESSILIPRALWRGRRLTRDHVFVELCTDEAETPRSLQVDVRPAPVTSRRVQFVVPSTREGVRRGFSGGPVVEIDDHSRTPRLLGIVRARDETSVDALDNAGAGWFVPTDCVADLIEQVAVLVEAPVERDPAWEQHWEPRSRGVATSDDEGFFFAGRIEAYERVRRYLDEGSGLLIVTGSRGRGKSAVLARAVVLGSQRYLSQLRGHASDAIGEYPRPRRPVDAVVLARDTTHEIVATEIGEQLGLGHSSAVELVAAIKRDRLKPSIVIDAVDEADDASALMRQLIAPLARTGARIAIGALRRRIALDVPSEATWIDLDLAPYRDDEAIPNYVAQRLSTTGSYETGTAQVVGRAVAERAQGIFLVAELMARTLSERDPINTTTVGWRTELPGDVTEAFTDYLARFGRKRARVLALLHPLAHARGEGLTIEPGEVWLAAANKLRPPELDPFNASDLRDAYTSAREYLIATREDGAARLYHEGLAEAVNALNARVGLHQGEQEATPEAIAQEIKRNARSFLEALMGLLPDEGAPADAYIALEPYLFRHLPLHLADQGRAEGLLDRPGLLLTADQDALRAALVRGAPAIPHSRDGARVAVVHALAWPRPSVAERAASLCAVLERQGERSLSDRIRLALTGGATPESRPAHSHLRRGEVAERAAVRLPYELIAAPPRPSTVLEILNAFDGPIYAFVLAELNGQALLIAASGQAIRSWWLDGQAGPLQLDRVGEISSLLMAELAGEPLLIGAGLAERGVIIQSWWLDGESGPLVREKAHDGRIGALVLAELSGEPLLFSAGSEGVIRSWRLDGEPGPLALEHAHEDSFFLDGLDEDPILVLAEFRGEPLLVSSDGHGVIRSWRLDGKHVPLGVERVHDSGIGVLVVAELEGEPLLISGGRDGAIRSWWLDGDPGPLVRENAHDGWINALVLTELAGEPLLISAGREKLIRSWWLDGEPGPFMREEKGETKALALAEFGGEPLLICPGPTTSIHGWRIADEPVGRGPEHVHRGTIGALVPAALGGESLLISAGWDGAIRSWSLYGERGPFQVERAHLGEIHSLVMTELAGEPLLISGGASPEGVIRSWWLDGRPGPLLLEHVGEISALVVAELGGEPLLVSAGGYDHLRSWRLDGEPGPWAVERAHGGSINALVLIEFRGEPLLISLALGEVIRSWRLDGEHVALGVERIHDREITALVVADLGREPLLISGGRDGAIRSRRLDGEPGPLVREKAHDGWIGALVLAELSGERLLFSAGRDGVIRSWRLNGEAGPLVRKHSHDGAIRVLVHTERAGEPLLISGGYDGAILAHRLRIARVDAVEAASPARGGRLETSPRAEPGV
jgi:WD40 repeat protein